jgi:cell division inhibitor SepF
MGLNGTIERVTGKVFLLAPESIAPRSGADVEAEQEQNDSGSFFVSAAAQ